MELTEDIKPRKSSGMKEEGPQKIEKPKYSPLLKNYDVPRGKIKTHLMEKLLLERLLVLLIVEKINDSSSMSTDEKIEKLLDILQHHKLKLYLYLLIRNGHPPEDEEQLEYLWQEKVAHIFLNGILSSWEESAKWVKQQELTLFIWQTFSYSAREAIEFMVDNGAIPAEATREEKEKLRDKLETYREDDDIRKLEDTIIYKVPWQLAIDLGGTRTVAHHLGLSYVPEEKMKGILPALYEQHLKNEQKNGVYKTAVTHGLGDLRLQQIQGFLFYVYSMKLRDFRKIRISMSTIDNYVNSFPPCARIIHDELLNKSHLKFNTRRQYWLFLKGIGTEANDVSDYMRHHFVELGRLSEQNYKEHHYFIRLLFGLVGSCIDYPTPDCADNLQDVRGSAEVNGCPFGNPGQVDIEDLDRKLTRWKISDTDKEEILGHRNKGECSEACSAYFRAIHEKPLRQEIVNPLDFFTASQELIRSRLEAVPEARILEQSECFSDEHLKTPFPDYPEVFSKELKARIRETLIHVVDREKKQQPKRIGDVQVQRQVEVEKKAEVPKPRGIIPPAGKRVSLMPKASSSAPPRKFPVASGFVPVSHRVKLRSPPPNEEVPLTDEERAEAREIMMKQALQLLGSGHLPINPSTESAPVDPEPKKEPREILIEQTQSMLEADLCPVGKNLVERACSSLKPELSVTTEALIDETLSHVRKDRFKNILSDVEPSPSEEESEEEKKDWTKGWKKRKKAKVWIRISEDDPDPNMEEMGKAMMKIFNKHIGKLPTPFDSETQKPSGEFSTSRKRKKNEDND